MFAVLLTHHPLWKFVLKPVLLNEPNGGSMGIGQVLNASNIKDYDLADWQKEIISNYEMTSESYLMKLFVREKISVVEFQKKFGPSFPNYELIIKSVEKSNYKVAKLVVEHQVPFYLKKKNFSTLYSSDKVEVSSELDNSETSFVLDESSTLHYSLNIKTGEKTSKIPLLRDLKDVYLLSTEPCCMVIYNRLYVFGQASYKKVAAFFSKKSIDVMPSSLHAYMKSFVMKSLQTEDVLAEGFTINRLNYSPQPVLTLREDLNQLAALYLDFEYGDIRVEVDAPNQRLVTMDERNGEYSYRVVTRDLDLEKYWADYLKKVGLRERNKFYYVESNQKFSILDFVVHKKSSLKDFKLKQELKETTFILEPVASEIELEEVDMDWFELKGIVRVGSEEIPFVKLRTHIIEGQRDYQMPDGRWILLPEELFSKYSELMRMTTKGDALKIRRSLIGLMNDTFATAKNLRLKMDEPERVPETIKADLRPYQEVGYSWLVKLYNLNYGGCLADDMGLGKTVQFLSFLQYIYPPSIKKQVEPSSNWIYSTSEPSLFDQPQETIDSEITVEPSRKLPTLVILPTSLVFNWVNEKNKFAPSLTYYVYTGEKRIKSKDIFKIFKHYNVIFTTYGIVRNDIEYLKRCDFECVVMDESQNLKNPSSQIYKAVMQLQARHYYCMTGTPIENGMMDLWAQMNLVNREILGSQAYFHRYFEQPILKEQNEERDALLRQIIKPFILRRTKKEVAKELPEKYTLEVFCEMSEEHKSAYESYKSAIRNSIMDDIFRFGKPREMTIALSSLTLMRQMANQVSLVNEEMQIPSTKVEEIMSRLESLKEEEHKVLIFSNFVKFLDVIEGELQKQKYRYSKITGTTKDRSVQVDRFQNDPETFCFLISLKAGGVGLNLTAADYVFLIDPWWNPAAEQQAEDRAYRIGQMRDVLVYRFIMKDTIEEKVLQLQDKKRTIADSFINQNNPFDSLDKSEWEDLFK